MIRNSKTHEAELGPRSRDPASLGRLVVEIPVSESSSEDAAAAFADVTTEAMKGGKKCKEVTGTCTICGKEAKHKCPCGTKMYCSKECQRVDWKERGHREACKELRAAEREEEAKRSEAPPSSPEPEGLVFYGPAERTYADEERSRIKANYEAARAWREANPEPPGPASVARYGKGCPICMQDWEDIDAGRALRVCCVRTICRQCSDKIGAAPCPLCREPCAKNDQEVVARLRRHAAAHCHEAQKELADEYRDGGLGLVKSAKKAAKLYQSAADLGNVDALVNLGKLHIDGASGVKLDRKKARSLYQKAAELGSAAARYNLALMHRDDGDHAAAFPLLESAAAGGCADAETSLGMAYYAGLGVGQDLDAAERLFLRAGARGDEEAKDALAHLRANYRPLGGHV